MHLPMITLLVITIFFSSIGVSFSAGKQNEEQIAKLNVIDGVPVPPEGIVNGVVVGLLKNTKKSKQLVKLRTANGVIYIDMNLSHKIKINNEYNFYPITNVNTNVMFNNIRMQFVYSTYPITNKSYYESRKIKFNGYGLSDKLPDNKAIFEETIRKNNNDAIFEYDDNSITIKNYKIGDYLTTVVIHNNYYGKISSIKIIYDDFEKNGLSLKDNIDIICDAMKIKHGLGNRDVNGEKYYAPDDTYTDCYWNFQGASLKVKHKVVNGAYKLYSHLTDTIISIQSYNIYTDIINKLNSDNKNEKEELIKKFKEDKIKKSVEAI